MGELGKIMTEEYKNFAASVFGPLSKNVGETERIISVAGGAVLLLAGLKNFSKWGIGLAIAGGALLFRGITAYCPVNAAIGRNTAEKVSDNMPKPSIEQVPATEKLVVETV